METNKNLVKWYMNEYILPNCPVNKNPNDRDWETI